MEMNSANVEEVVKQVLENMLKSPVAAPAASAPAPASQAIPKTAHVAMLTSLEHYDIKEFPIPEVGDGDILVKVEGCGVCGTDAHEFKRDPFGLIPVALGHEGTGESSTECNDCGGWIQIFTKSPHTCRAYDTKYQHE